MNTTKKTRKPSENLIIKSLVNMKCLGYLGKCTRSLGVSGRGAIMDEWIERGWTDKDLHLTAKGDEVVRKNLDLVES